MNSNPPMRSWMRWMGLTLGLTMLLALGGAPKAPAAETFRWKLQTIDLPAFIGPSVLLPNLVKRVRDMSGGRLQITVFTAGQLVPTMEISTALEKGTIDISYTSPVYYSGQIPEGNLVPQTLVPMIMPSTYDAKEIYWNRGIDDIFREAFAEHGIVYIQSVFLGDTIAHWSKKPLRSIEDVKGHKIRSYGYHAKTWAKLGASAVFIPHEEVYTSLAQGVIDGSETSASYYERAKYYEVAPYYYPQSLAVGNNMSFMVSKKSWDALPKDLQAIVRSAVEIYSSELELLSWQENDNMERNLKKMGATPIYWSQADLVKLKEAGMSLLPEIAAKGPRVAKGLKIIEDYLAEIKAGQTK